MRNSIAPLALALALTLAPETWTPAPAAAGQPAPQGAVHECATAAVPACGAAAAPASAPGSAAMSAAGHDAMHSPAAASGEQRISTYDPDSGEEMLGKPAPPWKFDRWIRSKPLSLESLRGKVVVLRWWTEGCRFCRATLPVLEKVQEREGTRDLVVIGVFHPKPPGFVSDRHILAVAKQLGFSGPIAVDSDWAMLDRYWLDGHPDRNWTSISFIIDRDGIIRWVHGGGEYHPSKDPRHASCDLEYHEFERKLAAVLGEKQATFEPAP